METLERKLREHPFLNGLSEEAVRFITGCAENVRFREGQHLAREGEPAEQTYLVRSGRVALEVHTPQRGAVQLVSVGDGEIFGWSWLFPPYQWHFDARATRATRAFRLDGRCLREKCQTDPALGFELVTRFLYQAQQRLEKARFQALDMYQAGERQ